MSEQNGTNGNGERMRAAISAVVENMALTAFARLSMVVWPALGTVVLSVGGWQLNGILAEQKDLSRKLTAYMSENNAGVSRRETLIQEHHRRITVLEGRMFGFSAPATSP